MRQVHSLRQDTYSRDLFLHCRIIKLAFNYKVLKFSKLLKRYNTSISWKHSTKMLEESGMAFETPFNNQRHYFGALNESRPSKIIWSILALFLLNINILAFWGIIWFERFGSDLKRIFINQIVVSISWSSIAWLSMIQTSDILLYFYRPLPDLYCLFNLVLRNALMIQAILFFDAIIIVRYIFIFWMKDPANFAEDFWYCFVNLWVVTCR